jgi:hypothetical protein
LNNLKEKKMKKRLLKQILACFTLALFSSFSHAALIAPSGLNVGDKFHLIFVTSGTTDAYSSDISTYNAFVQSTANNEGIGNTINLTDWRALASTPTLNASDNLAPIFNNQSNVPIYNMGGLIVSNSLLDLWSTGSINTILYEENGNPNYGDVWTGTTPNGLADPNTALGSSTLLSKFAFPYNASQNISAAPLAYTEQFNQNHLYGVSQELIVLSNGEAVLSAVPVPAALWLFGSGLLGLVFVGKRKYRT